MSGRGILSDIRHAGLWLALVAFMLKAAIPAGYMLAQEGPATVVLCTVNGAVTVTLDQPAGDHDPDAPAAKSEHCAFAGLAAAALAAPEASIAAPLTQAVYAAATPRAAHAAISQTGPPLPARGPPTLV